MHRLQILCRRTGKLHKNLLWRLMLPKNLGGAYPTIYNNNNNKKKNKKKKQVVEKWFRSAKTHSPFRVIQMLITIPG